MESMLLPTKVVFGEGSKPTEVQVIVEPCESGYGTTLGNALRRVLLSSLLGAAITDIKIQGAQHEFSTVPHVKEDIVQIILSVKQIRLRAFSDEPIRLRLTKKGEGVVTAGDIEKDSSVEIVNPDHPIATITDANGVLDMELVVGRGKGYDPVESREKKNGEIGLLAIDALYTPIRNVGFKVENTRVGQMTNYDRLVLNIETDGTISAEDAVKQSAQLLINHFQLFVQPENASGDMGIVSASESASPAPESV